MYDVALAAVVVTAANCTPSVDRSTTNPVWRADATVQVRPTCVPETTVADSPIGAVRAVTAEAVADAAESPAAPVAITL